MDTAVLGVGVQQKSSLLISTEHVQILGSAMAAEIVQIRLTAGGNLKGELLAHCGQ
jgi:hypothetical protein